MKNKKLRLIMIFLNYKIKYKMLKISIKKILIHLYLLYYSNYAWIWKKFNKKLIKLNNLQDKVSKKSIMILVQNLKIRALILLMYFKKIINCLNKFKYLKLNNKDKLIKKLSIDLNLLKMFVK